MEAIMTNPAQHCTPILHGNFRWRAFTLTLLCALMMFPMQPALAQTFSVIHTFTGHGDGFTPVAGVTLGPGGKLYGTTSQTPLPGTVFRMTQTSGSWTFNTLLAFDGQDGRTPDSAVVFGPDGALYGTTNGGGSGSGCGGCGVVYSLRPPQNPCRSVTCPWTPTVLYNFTGQPDAANPYTGSPVFDQAGNLYGTTLSGGSAGEGAVFELTRSDGGWTENVIQSFTGANGVSPYSGVVLDAAGNVYGTAANQGPLGDGVVYELTPSGSGWTQTILSDFPDSDTNGCIPVGGLTFDQSGNLYGTTVYCGSTNNGTVFELSPSGGGWNYTVLYSFGYGVVGGGGGPQGSLAMDAAGNLYGATYSSGAHGYGSVWKLTRSGNSWTFTDLHDFTGQGDGANPVGGPVVDANGNVYGTATKGGTSGLYCNTCGVVWEITP
jgi:uncharacterized repeat protein (TIGR03803 family)